jgi:hypothetical protein
MSSDVLEQGAPAASQSPHDDKGSQSTGTANGAQFEAHGAAKLKSDNERLLSELTSMKQQMKVVQNREEGMTKAYLSICHDVDRVLVVCI